MPYNIFQIDTEQIKKRRRFYNKYCIMSSKTLETLKGYTPCEQIAFLYTNDGLEITIYGLKVAICESLGYGEFDIR